MEADDAGRCDLFIGNCEGGFGAEPFNASFESDVSGQARLRREPFLDRPRVNIAFAGCVGMVGDRCSGIVLRRSHRR